MTTTLFRSFIMALLATAWLAGCSSTYSSRDDSGSVAGANIFALSLEDAQLVMEDAMQKEFPDDRIEDVLQPHRGYKAKLRFVADIDVITVYAVQGAGKSASGKTVEGYYFEVHRSGTYPVGGIPKAKAVLERVVEGASRLSEAMPKL